LLNAIPIPVFYKNKNGQYTGFNRAFEEFFGTTKERLIGKTVFDINPPELAEIYHAKDTELFKIGGVQQYETQVRNVLGGLRDVIFNKAVFTDSHGAISGLIGAILDITERKLADQRLSEEVALKSFLLDFHEKAPTLTDKDLYDYVLDHVVRLTDSAIGFFHRVSDDQKNVILTTWNKETLRNCTASYATHYPLDQAGNWVDCVRFKHPVIYNEFPSSPNQKGLPGGHTPIKRFMSVPVIEGDKVRIIFGVGNKSKEYSETDAILIQIVANDLQRIIAGRRAETSLISSEAYFRSLIENASDIIMIVDGDGIVSYISPSLEHVVEYKTSELTGRNIFEYVHPDDETAATDLFDRAVQNPGVTLSAELRMWRYDGPWHIFEIVAQNLLQNEAVKGIVINFHDITARRQAEKERETLIVELKDAMSKIKTLSGMLPICSSCKKIRDDKGYWNQIESYIKRHSEAEFSHGICPECAKIFYPEHYKEMYPEYDK
jgi:hypothetical protein